MARPLRILVFHSEGQGNVTLRDGSRYLVCHPDFSPLVLEATDGSEFAHAKGLGVFRAGFAVTHVLLPG